MKEVSVEEAVILVDEHDKQLGTAPKMEAHEKGLLHRAFSVFVFDSEDRLLLQQRASTKYHSANLWTNTCCSHPRVNESNEEAAERRLKEEMGLVCDVEHRFSFTYRSAFANGLVENELDHVFFARSDSDPEPEPQEAQAWRWVDMAALDSEMSKEPEDFTTWLRICWPEVKSHFERWRVGK